MKNSKLIDVLKDGNIVIPIYIYKNYDKLNINMEEFVFLMYLYNLGNKYIFNPNKFSSDLNIPISTIMNYISVLTDKKLIRLEVLKNDKKISDEVIVLDDFYQKLSLMSVNDESNDVSDSNIFELIEKEFGRTLSPIEVEIIKAWIENNTSEELIREALKEATFNGVSNLRYIDKILYEWSKAKVKDASDVEKLRMKRNKKEESDPDIDDNIFDWNWLDDDE